MRRAICTVATTALLAIVCTAVPAGAATDDEPGVGWKLGPGQKTLADDPRAIAEKPLTDALVDLYKAYDEVEKPGLSSAQLSAAARRATQLQAKVEKLSGEPFENLAPAPRAMTTSRTASADAVAAAAVPSSHLLPVQHSTQINDYYCGPASTLMALRAMGASEHSQLNSSHTLGQSRLASSTYLATSSSGGTYIYRMPTTMRDWAGVSSKVYTGLDRAGLKSVVRRSNGQYNKALIYGTHENAGTSANHYNNHYTNKALDHFVMGYGYSESGDRVHYADPVGGRWPQSDKKRSMTTNAMAGFTAMYGTVA
ncbi:C39 family peptidase [Aeromicrobium sp. CFBP 8757]|uniref:C39 family peptidase n=1 Tax=Aeromicrobium sp. CFBP 8757 TaxID=2775288 RepID=UPI001783F9EA|nr:C39 family peptidase [Aeromicrobium sp. CFBP 8757]MBD8607535.1 C39 family peptidase [Aeromicrobium sp. CFBP 8757]